MMITKKHIDILKHTLGLDKTNKSYRNYFVADITHHEFKELEELTKAGYMTKSKYTMAENSFQFKATDKGQQLAIQHKRKEDTFDVIKIVEQWLVKYGFDGLVADDNDCGCNFKDGSIVECGCIGALDSCTPAYLHKDGSMYLFKEEEK